MDLASLTIFAAGVIAGVLLTWVVVGVQHAAPSPEETVGEPPATLPLMTDGARLKRNPKCECPGLRKDAIEREDYRVQSEGPLR